MPVYATQQDLIDRIGERRLIELTDRATPAADAIDATVVAAALADADALIDGYVAGVYDLPLPSVPPLLRKLALDLAHYALHVDGAPDGVKDDQRTAIRTLERIAQGLVKLDVGGAEPPHGAGEAKTVGPDRIFTRDSLAGF